MLTLERCREILGDDCPESDSELELLRDQLYGLADVAVEAFIEDQKRRKNSTQTSPQPEIEVVDSGQGAGHVRGRGGFHNALAMLPDTERSDVEERAAIMESDGGLDRDTAERASFSDLTHRKRKQGSN